MQALIDVAGKTVREAAREVASYHAGARAETIRVEYYESRRRQQPQGIDAARGASQSPLLSGFFSWRDWALSADQETVDFVVNLYRNRRGKRRAEQLNKLIDELRADKDQLQANRVWLEEQLSGLQARLAAVPGLNLRYRIAHLAESARLLCRLNKSADALVPLRQALALCRTPGGELARREQVVAAIQSEINRISGGEPSKAPNGNHG